MDKQAVIDELARRIEVMAGEMRLQAVVATRQGGVAVVSLDKIRHWCKVLTAPMEEPEQEEEGEYPARDGVRDTSSSASGD